MFSTERPIYRQIRDRIVSRILDAGDGALLPSVRALAAEAGVNPLTVAKAYHDLQASAGSRIRRACGVPRSHAIEVTAGQYLDILQRTRGPPDPGGAGSPPCSSRYRL